MRAGQTRSAGSPSPVGRRRLPSRLGAAVALALLCAAPWSPAPAAAPIGTVYSTTFDLAGRQVPLPQGDWVLVGDGFEILPSVRGGAGDAVESVVLFRVEGEAVPAFVIAHRNRIGVDNGWGVASDCDRTDIHAAVTYDAAAAHGFCGFVNHVVTAVDGRSATSWKQAVAYAQAHRLALPPTWLMAGFRLSDPTDVVDVRYHFDPALAGMPTPTDAGWSDSRWSKAAVAGRPTAVGEGWGDAAWRWAGYAAFWNSGAPEESTAERRVVADLVAWLDRMRFPVERGFRNRVGDLAAVALPWSKDGDEPPAALALRLKRLDDLRARQVLTAEQYAEQRAIIVGEHGGEGGGRWTAEGLATAKAFAGQVASNIGAFAAGLWVTGNVATAASLVGAHAVAEAGRYWPAAWSWPLSGSRRIEAASTVDFAGAGIDRPVGPGIAPAVPYDGGGVLGRAPAPDDAGETVLNK